MACLVAELPSLCRCSNHGKAGRGSEEILQASLATSCLNSYRYLDAGVRNTSYVNSIHVLWGSSLGVQSVRLRADGIRVQAFWVEDFMD